MMIRKISGTMTKISLSEAKRIEEDFDIGEEVSEEISLESFVPQSYYCC